MAGIVFNRVHVAAFAVTLAVLPTAHAAAAPPFIAGAATESVTTPTAGELQSDPADCDSGGAFDGPRAFAFEEPYQDRQRSGHYDPNDPYLDCNGNGRWDGNLLGGGSDTPRYYTKVADPVSARALVVGNGTRTIAIEVLDNEGLFNVYAERIRNTVAQDGYHLDGIYISSTHDESAPDTIGLGGVTPVTSGTNAYYVDFMVERSAKAIERAYDQLQPATIRYAEATEPANLRQCWSSYPYTDDQLMPTLQAIDQSGHAIATLSSISQHAETLGFNPIPEQKTWISGDWPHFFRDALEQRYGGVGIEMAGSVGSVETPQVFDQLISRTPQQYHDASHPAGCRTIFDAVGAPAPLGYDQETKQLGEGLAQAVTAALDNAQASSSADIWGERKDVCLELTNRLFQAAAAAGVFAERPSYTGDCTVEIPPAPNGSTNGTELKTQVAAFRIGDGSFVSVPGEVFPFTYLRGFQGPGDMPKPQHPLPPWLLPHMHTPFRFVDGLGEDMVGYIFPRGNGVGVPGEDPGGNPTADSSDRFGCAHSDDSESATSSAGDVLGDALRDLLDGRGGQPEQVVRGRYVMRDGSLSRDPLGGPEVKCDQDQTFDASNGPARAVWVEGRGTVRPAAWMSLSGRRQPGPDRNTRGYFTKDGQRRWLDVFDELARAPAHA